MHIIILSIISNFAVFYFVINFVKLNVLELYLIRKFKFVYLTY